MNPNDKVVFTFCLRIESVEKNLNVQQMETFYKFQMNRNYKNKLFSSLIPIDDKM